MTWWGVLATNVATHDSTLWRCTGNCNVATQDYPVMGFTGNCNVATHDSTLWCTGNWNVATHDSTLWWCVLVTIMLLNMTHTCNTGIELQCSRHNNIVAEVYAYIVRRNILLVYTPVYPKTYRKTYKCTFKFKHSVKYLWPNNRSSNLSKSKAYLPSPLNYTKSKAYLPSPLNYTV